MAPAAGAPAIDQNVDVADPEMANRELARLFDENATSLVRLARLFVDHRDAAEDIVQEAFLRMARRGIGSGIPTRCRPTSDRSS